MKKFNLFAVAFVAFFTQSVIANAAKTNRGYFYFDAKKSEAKSVFAMGTDVAAMGIAKDGLFVYTYGAKAERGGKCRSAYPAIMGADVAAMGIAKEAYPPMQRGAKRGVEYPQTERGKC